MNSRWLNLVELLGIKLPKSSMLELLRTSLKKWKLPITYETNWKELPDRQKRRREHPYAKLQEIMRIERSASSEINTTLSPFNLSVKVKRGESTHVEHIELAGEETFVDKGFLEMENGEVLSLEGSYLGEKRLKVTKEGNRVRIANKYLQKQYNILERLRENYDFLNYYKRFFILLQRSIAFKTAHLSSWKKRWYKDPELTKKIFMILQWNQDFASSWVELLSKERLKNKWIESPKGKWRQLCIPSPQVRLFCHIFNNSLQHIMRPLLWDNSFHGFLYDKGCLTAWKTILKRKLWESSEIFQVDVGSGFPNLNLHTVKESLEYLNLPSIIIEIILNLLVLDQESSKDFPTFSSEWEHVNNKEWRASSRNVPMGLGISPVLYTWVTYYILIKKLDLTRGINWVNYADDLNLFFTESFYQVVNDLSVYKYKSMSDMKKNFLYQLNGIPELFDAGIQFDLKKNRKVKQDNKWYNDLELLGLRLTNQVTKNENKFLESSLELYGHTRGRGWSPKKPSTNPSRVHLSVKDSANNCLNLEWLQGKKGIKYIGLIQSLLYNHWILARDEKKHKLNLKRTERGHTIISQLHKLHTLPRTVSIVNGKYYSERFIMESLNLQSKGLNPKITLLETPLSILKVKNKLGTNQGTPYQKLQTYFKKYNVDRILIPNPL